MMSRRELSFGIYTLLTVLVLNAVSEETCKPCLEGLFVSQMCNLTQETICEDCPKDTYNSAQTLNQSCNSCKVCPENWYELTPCTAYKNTGCEQCAQGGGHGNEDFNRKCMQRTTTTTVSTTRIKITDFTGSTVEIGSGEVSSGEGPDDGTEDLITVESPKIFTPNENVQGTPPPSIDQVTDDNDNSTLRVLVPPTVIAKTYEVTEGKFKPWWIILAVILAVLVCVIIAGIVRQYRKKRKSVALNEKPKSLDTPTVIEMNDSDSAVKVPLTQNGGQKSSPSVVTDPSESDPIYTGNAISYTQSTPEIIREPNRSDIYRAKRRPKKTALKKSKSFCDSRDFIYIDEDSDDEVVRHLGRPPSVYYRETTRGGSVKRRSIEFLRSLMNSSSMRPRSGTQPEGVAEQEDLRRKKKRNSVKRSASDIDKRMKPFGNDQLGKEKSTIVEKNEVLEDSDFDTL